MKNRLLVIAITLLCLSAFFAAQTQAPTPKAAANQGNQPAKPGPAQKTAHEPAKAAQTQPWKQIPIPRLPAFNPAIPKRIELANGMMLFLQEDHELPLITALARIRGGSRLEPAAKVGLVDMYGDVWRTGGTKNKTGDQLDDFLEARAAKVETDGGTDSTTISLNCLKQDFDDVFSVFLDLLHNPEFREDKIDLVKKQMNSAISRRNDDPGSIAGREAAFLAYGKNNPYARVPEYSTVAAVTRADMANWHNSYVHPNNTIFGIVGDFDSAAMEAKLRKAFESWQKGSEAPKQEIEFNPAKPGLYYAAKEDVNQSEIRMVALGIRRDNPDYYAVTVMNEVFGGGMSARLFSNIRTKLGLAYSVGGGIGSAFDHPGIFRLSMGTKSQTTAEAIKALNDEIQALINNPPSEDELRRGKDQILNSFVFNFDSPQKVLSERMAYEFYHYPLDFLERYRAGVDKVTAADVARVAKKYVHPGEFAILVVGNDEADKTLAALGPVAKLDIAIPPPAGAQAPSTAAATASNPEGKALIAKVVEGLGGAAKLQSIKAIEEKINATRKTPQGEMPLDIDSLIVFPDRARQQVSTPMGPVLSVITPSASFMSMGGQVRDLPASAKEEGANSIKRDMIYVAQHANDPKFVFTAGPTEKIGNTDTRVLDINADGASTRWYVDPQTGHVLRIAYSANGMQGPVQRVQDNADFKAIDGLTLPFSASISENGEQVSKVSLQDVKINPPVDPKAFDKPAAGASPGGM